MRNEPWVAEGGECRDKQRGSSASEVSTDDGTAKKNKKYVTNSVTDLIYQYTPTQMRHTIPFTAICLRQFRIISFW